MVDLRGHTPYSLYCRMRGMIREKLGGRPPDHERIGAFGLTQAEAEARRPQNSPIADLFFANAGRPVEKWLHYFEAYDRLFAPWRGKDVRMLEIGVRFGGSLDLWRAYFGEGAVIFGIDIDEACAGRFDPPNEVRIGSQADESFLKSVLNEMGPPDIILDDGSHVARHQLYSFKYLFPALAEGGLYVIEDVHTAYWRDFGGGYGRRDNPIGLAKEIIDDMHGWYHKAGRRHVAPDIVRSVTAYDSIIAIEKKKSPRPGYFSIGHG